MTTAYRIRNHPHVEALRQHLDGWTVDLKPGFEWEGRSSFSVASLVKAWALVQGSAPVVVKKVGTIDLTPTWVETVHLCVAVIENGTATGRAMAIEELMRLARHADSLKGGAA